MAYLIRDKLTQALFSCWDFRKDALPTSPLRILPQTFLCCCQAWCNRKVHRSHYYLSPSHASAAFPHSTLFDVLTSYMQALSQWASESWYQLEQMEIGALALKIPHTGKMHTHTCTHLSPSIAVLTLRLSPRPETLIKITTACDVRWCLE